jgi:hypothetical protein
MQMNIRKSILTSLLLAVIGLFLAGCGCDGECPVKKMFGGSKSAKGECPASQTAPADANMK